MTELLEWIVKERGKPRAIRTDNGPEFTSSVFTNWCHKHRIEFDISNLETNIKCFIERFNRSYRTEVLDARIFNNFIEVRETEGSTESNYCRMDGTLQQRQTSRKFTKHFSNAVFVEKEKLASVGYHNRVFFLFNKSSNNDNTEMKYFIILQKVRGYSVQRIGRLTLFLERDLFYLELEN